MARPEAVRCLPLPDWRTSDLAAALGDGPVALFEGLTAFGRRCALVAWAPTAWAATVAEAQAAAEALGLPPDAPPLLAAAVGSLDWDGQGHFWLPGSAALFDPDGGQLWVRGDLPAGLMPQLPAGSDAGPDATPAHTARPLWSYPDYAAAVQQALDEMAAGRLAKVILSVPFAAPCTLSPLAVYHRLTAGDPPGLGFLLTYREGALVGLSPEPLASLDGRRAAMHLLAGTRPTARANELLSSPKDREEHAVAVDQARRDLLRACEPETVSVDTFMELEAHPGLVHLSSRLSGALRADASPSELVAACFPAGTVGGIPREPVRQLIDRLEPVPRQWYAGAVGVVMPGGDLQFWLTIRSLYLGGGEAVVRTGAGLVPGSDPRAEWQECLAKASRALAAVNAAIPAATGYTDGPVEQEVAASELPGGA